MKSNLTEYMEAHEEPFVALLTASAVGTGGVHEYTWAEQVLDGDTGNYVDLLEGRSGGPTFQPIVEINNNSLTVPTLVWAKMRGSTEGLLRYECDVPAGVPGPPGGTITVRAADGTPSLPAISILEVTEANGFVTIFDAGTGIARLILNDASVSNSGIVNLTDGQALGLGSKKVQSAAAAPYKQINLDLPGAAIGLAGVSGFGPKIFNTPATGQSWLGGYQLGV